MIAVLLALLLSTSAPQAQPHETRATITVVDQSGAVIPNASVTVTNEDDQKIVVAPAKTNDHGIATLTSLAPGRYTIQAEFPGFETRQLKDVRLKAGDNKHVVVLTIQALQDSVTVARDKQEAAADRKTTFGTALTREQIDALSDDPNEMAQQLQDMAGGNGVIRVDSFEGAQLPLKSQIKAVHITRDAFAAENHYAGGIFIDIITQPGIGKLRVNMNARVRNGAWSGSNEFTPVKGPELTQSYSGGVSGSLIHDKSDYSVSINGTDAYQTPAINLALPNGTTSQQLGLRQPQKNLFAYGLFNYAITRDQTLRVIFTGSHFNQGNLGVGAYDNSERAYSQDQNSDYIRLQEAGPLGRRFFANTRLSIGRWDSSSHSALEAPTIKVLDAFTSGGQQIAGGSRDGAFTLASDLDYVRGIHSLRTGLQLDGGDHHTDSNSDYLGTYTFDSTDDFNAGTPSLYTRRIGDPNISYWNVQLGVYVQDDIRVRKGLTLSPGIRFEGQTHVRGIDNPGPRFGITWAPGKDGKTTLRGSAGMFYDWLDTGTYEQTLRVDGFRERELSIVDPRYPDPGSLGTISTTSRYLLGPHVDMQRFTRVTAGIDRALTRQLRMNVLYQHTSGDRLPRGENLNAPVDGVRPDPRFDNVIEVLSDAASRQNTVNVGLSMNFASAPGSMMNGIIMFGGPAAPSKTRWDWHKLTVFSNMSFGRIRNDTDGAFTPPATGTLADNWGPANNDVERRFNMILNSSQLKNLSATLMFNASSATPYTILTGHDDNGDLIFNDRPDGVGRNSVRASGAWSLNGYFNYSLQFGKSVAQPPGIGITSGAGGLAVTERAPQAAGRYRVSIFVNAQNLTNRQNLGGYSGVLTSPFFGRATLAQGTRKIDVGMGISF
jgi:hypothetical protein